MADQRFFIRQMEKLANVYGKKNYPDERITLIWDIVKHVKDIDLGRMINDFIGDSRNPPMREDFRRIIRERQLINFKKEEKSHADSFIGNVDNLTASTVIGKILKSIGDQEKGKKLIDWAEGTKKKQASCMLCNNSGLIQANLKQAKLAVFTFKCICPVKEMIDAEYPSWNANFAENYEIE